MGDGTLKQSPTQAAELSNAAMGLFQRTENCTYKLNSSSTKSGATSSTPLLVVQIHLTDVYGKGRSVCCI
jgi:hypothetical protein